MDSTRHPGAGRPAGGRPSHLCRRAEAAATGAVDRDDLCSNRFVIPVDLLLFSPLGERLSERVIQESAVGCTPSPNLAPEGERNMTPSALLLPRG
jgi:hypothetical protein